MRFSGCDGIRGFACLLVLLTHIPTFFFQEYAKFFFGTGKFGVWLFFVLSAFLLTAKFIRSGFSVVEISKYFIGRCLRIIPLFYLVILACWVFGVAGVVSLGDVSRAMLFGSGYAHLWTIPVEFKFYFVLPAIAFGVLSAERKFGGFGGLIFVLLLVVVIEMFWPYWMAEINDIRMCLYIPCFAFGVYASVLVYTGRVRVFSSAYCNAIGVAIFAVLVLMTPGARNMMVDAPFDAWLSDKFIYIGLLWAVFIFVYCDAPGVVGRILKSRLLRLYGAWSYSIYLIHWIVYSKFFDIFGPGAMSAISAFFVSTAVGAVVYYIVEAPIERWRHLLVNKIFGRQISPAS
jgi:peptidoglycan/LPS O-acetylase OafA/YrhL